MGTERMGISMDESEQLYPEQSTTALIVYHPVTKLDPYAKRSSLSEKLLRYCKSQSMQS